MGTLDTKVFGVLAVTVPSGRSCQSSIMVGQKDACLYAVEYWIGVSCLECLLLCLGKADQFGAVDHDFAVKDLEEDGEWQFFCDVVERATRVCQSFLLH